MKLGVTDISNIKLGAADVSKAYLGSQVVWMPGPVLPSDVLLYAPLSDTAGSTSLAGYYKSGASHILEPALFTGFNGALTSAGQSKVTGAATSAYNPATTFTSGFVCDSTISDATAVGSASPMSIEFWFYNSGAANDIYPRLISWGGWSDEGSGLEAEFYNTSQTAVTFHEYSGPGTDRRELVLENLPTDTWHHIYYAFDPLGPSYFAADGEILSFVNYMPSFSPESQSLSLGKTSENSQDSVQGYFQELIVRNSIPYTANFTPSTTPLL